MTTNSYYTTSRFCSGCRLAFSELKPLSKIIELRALYQVARPAASDLSGVRSQGPDMAVAGREVLWLLCLQLWAELLQSLHSTLHEVHLNKLTARDIPFRANQIIETRSLLVGSQRRCPVSFCTEPRQFWSLCFSTGLNETSCKLFCNVCIAVGTQVMKWIEWLTGSMGSM